MSCSAPIQKKRFVAGFRHCAGHCYLWSYYFYSWPVERGRFLTRRWNRCLASKGFKKNRDQWQDEQEWFWIHWVALLWTLQINGHLALANLMASCSSDALCTRLCIVKSHWPCQMSNGSFYTLKIPTAHHWLKCYTMTLLPNNDNKVPVYF